MRLFIAVQSGYMPYIRSSVLERTFFCIGQCLMNHGEHNIINTTRCAGYASAQFRGTKEYNNSDCDNENHPIRPDLPGVHWRASDWSLNLG